MYKRTNKKAEIAN